MISTYAIFLAHVLGEAAPAGADKETLGLDYWTTISFVMPTESVAPPLKRDTEDRTRNVYTKKSINFEKLSERYEVMAEKGSPLLVLIDKEYGPLRQWKETAKLLEQAKNSNLLIPVSELSDAMFQRLQEHLPPIANPKEAKALVDVSKSLTVYIDGAQIHHLPISTSSPESWEKLGKAPIEQGSRSSRPNLKNSLPEVDTSYRVKPGRYGDEVEIAERLQELLIRESQAIESLIAGLLPASSGGKPEMRLDELPGEQKSALIEKLRNEVRQGNLTDLQVEKYLSSNPTVQVRHFVTMLAATGERSRYQVTLYSSYRQSPK